MLDDDKRKQAIDLYDRFTHEGMDRRDFFTRMTAIAGSAAAASTLIASIAASPAAAAIRPWSARGSSCTGPVAGNLASPALLNNPHCPPIAPSSRRFQGWSKASMKL